MPQNPYWLLTKLDTANFAFNAETNMLLSVELAASILELCCMDTMILTEKSANLHCSLPSACSVSRHTG